MVSHYIFNSVCAYVHYVYIYAHTCADHTIISLQYHKWGIAK